MLPLSGFKKTAEDDKMATLTHDKGHVIKIAKSGLSKVAARQLASLPLHKDSGGEISRVDDDSRPVKSLAERAKEAEIEKEKYIDIPETNSPEGRAAFSRHGIPMEGDMQTTGDPNSVASQVDRAQAGTVPAAVPSQNPPIPVNLAPEPPPFTVPNQSAQNILPTDKNAQGVPVGNDFDQAARQVPGYSEQEQAAYKKEQADTAYGHAVAAAHKADLKANQDAIFDLQHRESNLNTDIGLMMQDIKNSHIKPNQYMESMSTGSKIGTAIGLLLGGVSSAQTGQANPAATWLNSQIDRDLKSQQDNLSSKHNLLSSLHRQYGDMMVASNVYKGLRAQTLADQIGMAQGQYAGPAAEANRLQAVGAFKQKAADYMRTAALFQMQNEIQSSPAGPDMDQRAQNYLRVARQLDPKAASEFEKRYVPGVGVASVPLELRDRDKLQKQSELHNLLQRAEEYLQESGTVGHPLPGAKRAEGQSISQQINLRMGELAELTRFTPEENKIYRQTVPDLVGTHITGKDEALLKGIKDTNSTALNTFFKQKGIHTEAGADDAVKVISPKGVSGTIKQSQLPAALKQGYKQVGK